ncbi:MAG: c-type cytochrome [Bryobacterales bacterium]
MRFALLLLGLAASLAAQHADRNPFHSREDLEEGKRLYRLNCGVCHGMEGKSGRGARLAVRDHRHGNADAALFRVIQNGVPGTEMPGLWMDEDSIWRILLFVRTFEVNAGEACPPAPGDAARGAALYRDKACQTCHMTGGQGGRLGPDLTHIGLNYSREQLRESLVDPDKNVAMQYRTVIAVAGGSTVDGVLLNEDAYTVNLLDRGERFRRFDKAKAKIEKPAKSLMPAYQNLSEGQMNDMLAYLCSLRGKENRQ